MERNKKRTYDYYMLERDKEDNLVILNYENALKVEAMIRSDVNFKKAYDVTKGPNGKGKSKYIGSSAYWGERLKNYFWENKNDDKEYKEVIENFVDAVDNENSTHLSTNDGRKAVKDIIMKIGKQLYQYLRDANYDLVDIIDNPKDKETHRYSFATKFCHYACYYIFKDTDSKKADNFAIFDSILEKYLPLYFEKYDINWSKVNYREKGNYSKFIEDFNKLKKTVNKTLANDEQITLNDIDHIIWYYHRGN